jgi:hypothetical protein
MNFYENNILFLKGIHLNQIISIEDQFDSYMKDIIDDGICGDITEEIIIYDKIPYEYNKKTWPVKTNLKCWKCDRSFSNQSVFIAIQSWHDEDGLKMIVDRDMGGNFCSGDCAYTCIRQDYPQTARQGKIAMLRQLLNDLFPGKEIIFKEIIPKTARQEYGGNMTYDEYSAKN